ncbi:transposase family protein [Streptomonospora salina]|uniref:transposase family protein n=1 Tax=Streptomonospora salina TaxID=104205 RepID=UPI0031EBEFFE
MVTYRAILDVGREAVHFLSKLPAGERRRRGTRAGSRALTCFHQAVLVLRHFRDGTLPCDPAPDFAIGRATAYRYTDEGTDVLAEQAPDLDRALQQAREDGATHLIPDGTVVATDRCTAKTLSVKGERIDLWYSGKAGHHGGNLQALCEPDGFPAFVSDVEPSCVHDVTAARIHVLPALYPAAARGAADAGRSGLSGSRHRRPHSVHHPQRRPRPGGGRRNRRPPERGLRCLGERGFALLTQRWRLLKHITASPTKIGGIAQAALVLTRFEHGRLN